MATFTMNGYEVRSTPDHAVSVVKTAELQIVSSLGSAALSYDYVSDAPGSAEVSLSDYNILINGLHLNDGVLPDRIELFNFKSSAETGSHASQVMNFAYESEDGHCDFMFCVGDTALPNLLTVADVNALFKTAEFSLVKDPETSQALQIHLADVPDVSIDGVILPLFKDDSFTDSADTFSFFQKSDMEEFDESGFTFIETPDDIPAQASRADAPTYEPEDAIPDFVADPSVDDFGG